jgi:nuclear transport factor 2 (NTF2) superfamily protein
MLDYFCKMDKERIKDLYTDYLLSSFGKTTATGLSSVLDGALSHDQITRFLSSLQSGSKELWKTVKSLVRTHEKANACLIFDDSIIEKEYTDENEIICWHWDHSTKKAVKGINLLTAFYHSDVGSSAEDDEVLRIPIAFEMVTKTLRYYDEKTKKEKRKSTITKNELLQQMIAQVISNQLVFKYVIADSWFGSAENMRFIKAKKKFFIFDMKSNRQVALTKENRNKGQWTSLEALNLIENTPTKVWLKDLEFEVFLIKQVFKNKDNSVGVRFLVSNDFDLSADDFKTIYKKRWSVEEYHKSLKQNAGIGKSPTRTVQTQSAHLFTSILAYVKLEGLKLCRKVNHFALKAKVYLAANKAAFAELQKLRLLEAA